MADAVMVSSSFLPGQGGIESYLGELCESLAPRLAVLAAAERDGKPLPADLGYPVHPFAGRLLMPGRAARRTIEEAARAESTDRILFGTPWPLVMLAPKLQGLRYAVIVHGAEMIVPAAVPTVKARLAKALAGADLLLPVSEYTGRALTEFIRRAGHEVPPVEVLRAEVDTERFRRAAATPEIRTRYGFAPDDKIVLCFGRLVPRKGVHRLIDALPSIKKRVPSTRLVIAGTGPEEAKLKRRAEKHGDAVVFTGRVSDHDAPGLYASADVFALPVADRWRGLEIEGLGVVLLEAAACEVPCVTGISGGTPEAVIDGATGFVVDATDQAVLEGRITWLIEHPEQARRMGAAGRAHVQSNFGGAIPQALIEWLT